MHPYGGFGIGFIAGFVYVAWNVFLRWCRVDDISDTIAGLYFSYLYLTINRTVYLYER